VTTVLDARRAEAGEGGQYNIAPEGETPVLVSSTRASVERAEQ
jgi:hypothetical protein